MPTAEQLIALKKIAGDNYVPPTEDTTNADNVGPEDEKKTVDATGAAGTTAQAPDANGSTQPPVVVATPDDIDDAKILEYLKKRNINVASLDELAPKEDPAKLLEKKQSDKLAYALNKSLFSRKEYENYVADSTQPDTLVFAEYLREALEEDPEANEEDIRTEFIDKYGISEPVTSRKYKRGVQELALLSDKILKSKHGKIYTADNSYSQHEQELSRQREREMFLLQQTPKYKADLDDILTNLKGQKIQLSDTEDFTLDLSDDYLQGLKAKFSDPAYMDQLVEKNYDKAVLAETVFMGALRENFPKLMKSYAEKLLLSKQAGVKGIVHVHTGTSKEDQMPVLNDKQQKALNLMKERVERPLAN
jgi:menaquinone-dependent protoporphyrinogen IX oxidase